MHMLLNYQGYVLVVVALFAWLISHQPAVLFSHNKPATSNQPAVLFSQNKPAPAISHQPTEQAECRPSEIIKSLLQTAVTVGHNTTFSAS
jgi:hypothetical protein